jgi:hypothetical protein
VKRRLLQAFKRQNVFLAIAFAIVFSLVIHAFDFHHHHPGEVFGHDEYKAFLHGGDKQWWLLLLLSTLSLVFVGFESVSLEKTYEKSLVLVSVFRRRFDMLKLFDPLQIAFRRGILNAKLCG